MNILIIAEHTHQSLHSSTFHTLTAAEKLGGEIDLLIIGHHCQLAANKAAHFSQLKKILIADHEVYAHQLAENTAILIAKIAKAYDYTLIGATTFGKNVLPRAAALMGVSMVSDVVEIISQDTFVRPLYAGNVLATVQTTEQNKLLSIRTALFPETLPDEHASVAIQSISDIVPNLLSRFEHQSLTPSTRPELTSARIVVSGGRGLKSAENFHLLEEVADCLGAAVGASRAAVDAGFAPNDYQVGQTGKVIAPDLYIAVGISGAIQHLAGMKESKIVVAINNDAEAPILQAADYVLVDDLFKALPALKQALEK